MYIGEGGTLCTWRLTTPHDTFACAPQNRVWTPLGPSGPTKFDSPLHFTPTTGGPYPLGVVAPHPKNPKLDVSIPRGYPGPKDVKGVSTVTKGV